MRRSEPVSFVFPVGYNVHPVKAKLGNRVPILEQGKPDPWDRAEIRAPGDTKRSPVEGKVIDVGNRLSKSLIDILADLLCSLVINIDNGRKRVPSSE